MIFLKILRIPLSIKSCSINDFYRFNYVFFFSKMGFIKYKFDKNLINIKSLRNKLRLAGPDFSTYKTYQKLISNIFESVFYAFNLKINLIGLGFKYRFIKNQLYIIIGYSHLVKVEVEKNIRLEINKKYISIFSHDMLLINKFFHKLKTLRPLDVYKGKGFRLAGQDIKLKKGKQSSY